MSSLKVRGEVSYGEGQSTRIDIEQSLTDIEITFDDLAPGACSTEQISGNTILLLSDTPFQTNILGGTPQHNVRMLLFVADSP